LRTPLIIVVATTLVGCSREPPHQAITPSSADQRQFAGVNRTAARQPNELASFKARSPTETKLKTERPQRRRDSHRTAHHVKTKAKPTHITAKTEPSANRRLLPPPSSSKQLEPKSGIAAPGSGTTAQPTVGLAPNSNSRTIQQQVAAATAVAERMTAALATRKTDLLVAIVLANPEIRSVSDLKDKGVAMDEKYSSSGTDVWIAFVAAGALSVHLSAEHTRAIDRLLNGEVLAAVLTLASAESAEAFPDIPGFKVFKVPLSPQ